MLTLPENDFISEEKHILAHFDRKCSKIEGKQNRKMLLNRIEERECVFVLKGGKG